jgi:hypothetical protein
LTKPAFLIAILLALCASAAVSAQAQTLVNPHRVEFNPSDDHSRLTADGQPMVQRYDLQFFLSGATQPVTTVSLGKPTPESDGKIRVDYSSLVTPFPLADGNYSARVAAVGPGGSTSSAVSNAFSFQACSFSLGSVSQTFPAGGGAGSVTVNAVSGCDWTVTSAATWITLGTTGGSGPGIASFTVAANAGIAARTANVTIAGQAFAVYQAGTAAIRADFTGDGKSDILWRHATRGEVWLWAMNGGVRTSEAYIRTVADTTWEILGLGDQNGDGTPDILWRRQTNGAVCLWPMGAGGPLAELYLATVDPAYEVAGTGDYNGDGKSDILWRHQTTGEVWMWLMDGTVRLAEVFITTVDPAFAVVGSGDLNGDRKADIVWRHKTLGEVWVWLMNGATPAAQARVATVPDMGYQVVGVADHTGDGKADILWQHATHGDVWLWTMNGTARLAESWVDTVPDINYHIVGTGDYDGDGKADILWHHVTLGDVWVWLMNGAQSRSEPWVARVSDVGYRPVAVK